MIYCAEKNFGISTVYSHFEEQPLRKSCDNILDAVQFVTDDPRETKLIYVDGSSFEPNLSISGYSVYYGKHDWRNKIVPMSRSKFNDYYHEDCSYISSLDIRNGQYDEKYTILSDSEHSIDAIVHRAPEWRANNWYNNSFHKVKHVDIIDQANRLYSSLCNRYRANGWGELNIIHVHAHDGIKGNEIADGMAKTAALQMYRR
ncbi:hypothetical protein CAAN1_03S06788 [[Candida] anglica]|uniref:RNase H type-1 domain-containing protein n=1 Tax=[Candida] anglica TaxID=148631 RepID=A0ABP0EHA4_9ASCO